MKKTIFISYSQEDSKWLELIKSHISSKLQGNYDFQTFIDRESIKEGDRWDEIIKDALSSADCILMLVSHHYFASEFIRTEELPTILERVKSDKVFFAPIFISKTAFPSRDLKKEINSYHGVGTPKSTLLSYKEAEKTETINIHLSGLAESIAAHFEFEIDAAKDVAQEKSDSLKVIGQPENDAPASIDESVVMVFDIDGTVLEGEDNEATKRLFNRYLTSIKQLADLGCQIVFITGNDIKVQKKRILRHTVAHGIAESVKCFSDGGSRLFVYDERNKEKGYYEDVAYSKGNEISKELLVVIEPAIAKMLQDFLTRDYCKTLKRPNIAETKRKFLSEEDAEFVELTIRPIEPEFYRDSLDKLIARIRSIEKSLKPRLHKTPQIVKDIDALILRFESEHAFSDAERIKDRLIDLFVDYDEFMNIATPKLHKRGSENFTSQLAIKPFKFDHIRTEFLEKLKKELPKLPGDRKLSILLGGRTTIDIQLENVNKRKAVTYLIEEYGYDTQKMFYFGDEFSQNGNDVAVAVPMKVKMKLSLDRDEKEYHYDSPRTVINVGRKNPSPQIKSLPNVHNTPGGPKTTIAFLEFLVTFIEHFVKFHKLNFPAVSAREKN